MADTNYVFSTEDDWTLLFAVQGSSFSVVQLVQKSSEIFVRVEAVATPPGPADEGGFTMRVRGVIDDLNLSDTLGNGVGVYARGAAQWCVYTKP